VIDWLARHGYELIPVVVVLAWLVWRSRSREDDKRPSSLSRVWVGVEEGGAEASRPIGGGAEAALRTAGALLRRASPSAWAWAATCAPEVKQRLVAGGHDVSDVRARLHDMAERDERSLEDSVRRAARLAGNRGEGSVTLADLWNSIAGEPPPLGAYLDELDVRLELEPTLSGDYLYVINDATSRMDRVIAVLREALVETDADAFYAMHATHLCGYAAVGPFSLEELDRRAEAFARSRDAHRIPLRLARRRPDVRSWAMTDHGLLPTS
jgi:hypothetical protein